MVKRGLATLLILTLVFSVIPGYCGSTESHDSHHSDHSTIHLNHVGFFIGGTTKTTHEGLTGFTLGLDYNRRLPRLSSRLAIGVFGEVVYFGRENDEYEVLFGVPVQWYLTPQWFLQAGPGIEITDEHGESVINALVRVGTAYRIHWKGMNITPNLNWDFVRGDPAVVFGIALGKGF